MQVLNKVPVSDKKDETIIINGKNYYVCSVCGRIMFKKIKAFGKIYCNKHYKQQKKYGKPLDNNPRTSYDKNEIRIDNNIAYMDLYDKNSNVIATTIFDPEDIDKVRYTKWKLSSSGYVMNTPKYKGHNKHFSRTILQTNQFVDHINHNTLDNRKINLRVVTKSQNQMNVNYKGIYKTNYGKYDARIKINQKVICLGIYIDKEEAMFARWYAEKILFGEYAYPKKEPDILDSRKEEIKSYVNKKVQRL